jgi:pimeloyl-ACP methyl ester carboxylesterase
MDHVETAANIDGEGALIPSAARGEADGSLDDLERELAALWARVLGVDAVGVRDTFLDLGGDSLTVFDLLQLLRSDFGLVLPQAELLRCGTVEHCAALIRTGSRPDRGSPLVPLNVKGSGPPLYLVHDMTGEVLSYSYLVRHLGTGRPIYGFQARGFEGIPPFQTIEEEAAFFADALRAARPRGPCVLGGYSQGGPLAYEMARQLLESESGPEVEAVVIIDAANYNPTPRIRWDARTLARGLRNVPLWIKDELFHMSAPEFRRRVRLRRSRFVRWLCERPGRLRMVPGVGREPDLREPLGVQQMPPGYAAFLEAGYRARAKYIPGPYPGRVVLIRGRTQPLTLPSRHDLGWGGPLGGRLEVRVVPGGHNLLLPPFAARVAEELRDCLRIDQGVGH